MEITIPEFRFVAIRSQQIFAHGMTVQLSCHVQNFVAIISITILIDTEQIFEKICKFWVKIHKWDGPLEGALHPGWA